MSLSTISALLQTSSWAVAVAAAITAFLVFGLLLTLHPYDWHDFQQWWHEPWERRGSRYLETGHYIPDVIEEKTGLLSVPQPKPTFVHHRAQPSTDSQDVFFDSRSIPEASSEPTQAPVRESVQQAPQDSFKGITLQQPTPLPYKRASQVHPAFRTQTPDLTNMTPPRIQDHPVPFQDVLPTISAVRSELSAPAQRRSQWILRQGADRYFGMASTTTLVTPTPEPRDPEFLTDSDSRSLSSKPSYEDLYPLRGRSRLPRRLSGFTGAPMDTFNTPDSEHPSNIDDGTTIQRSQTWSNMSPVRGPGRRIGWWHKTPEELAEEYPSELESTSSSDEASPEADDEDELAESKMRRKLKFFGLIKKKKKRPSLVPDEHGRVGWGIHRKSCVPERLLRRDERNMARQSAEEVPDAANVCRRTSTA